MTVQALITSIASKVPNTLANQDYVDFINELESAIYTDIIKEYLSAHIPLVANIQQYSFPSGVTMNDIDGVFVYGVEYDKLDLRQKNTGYYQENSKLALRPIPSETDTKYTSGAGQLTFASGSITTTGTAFTQFAVGDTVLISGATTSANNKYAVITAVTSTVLSFPTGTFSAGLDAAAVTIHKPSLEIVYRYKPTAKLVSNIATDTLLLPDAFLNIYNFYIYQQIYDLRRQYEDAGRWADRYNARIAEFKIWYENNRPKKQVKYKKSW